MAWVETGSPNFTARHEEHDEQPVLGVLQALEATRTRLVNIFPRLPEDVTVVVHDSQAQLDLAQPILPVLRRLTAPAARRYIAGWATPGALHVLAPRVLSDRASKVTGSREMLLLTPSALYVQLVVSECNALLPPPWGTRTIARGVRWAWLIAGTAQFFSGQTAHARPAIVRRLREGPRPEFPPRLRDAALLGGTVIDLLAREQGERAAAALACSLPPGGPRGALGHAFDERSFSDTEGTWRAHLARLASY